MKLIIAGSRSIISYKLLKYSFKNSRFSLDYDDRIVSGTAKGPDTLGEKLAKNYGLDIKRFPANWDKHGKSAGFIRNKKKMAEYSDGLLALWDGLSNGTEHMIETAEDNYLKTHVFEYDCHTKLNDSDHTWAFYYWLKNNNYNGFTKKRNDGKINIYIYKQNWKIN